MLPIEFHTEAVKELLAAHTWYEKQSIGLGTEFSVEIEHALKLIQEFPKTWPLYDQEARRFLIHRFPFAIIDRFNETVIQVLAVMHLHRKPGYWKERAL